MQVSNRKLSEIQLSSAYLRMDTDVESLKKSIQHIGLINPVTVNTDNELLAGARRFQAVKELGWSEIPVQIVEREQLEQELISIDENLVRKALTRLELENCLNRGREIYETLNPAATKVDLSTADEGSEVRQQQKEQQEQDENSFAAITAEKTGLSKSVIQGAIKRDALAASAVKQARSQGELNATQTNEIIKLEQADQEAILPLIADKTVKEARKIINAAKQGGMTAALQESEKLIPLPREYKQILSPVKRVNKNLSRILMEELRYEGPEQVRINDDLLRLKQNLEHYFEMMGIDE